ncbi:MAG: thioredoxin family protein [Phaeodactylibacter sp.]|nr:thioredoxin family protein [Phaeodactylibacter sp.]MCB9276597.1 thioredoxin family protein [Lewinellaceae bacterium]
MKNKNISTLLAFLLMATFAIAQDNYKAANAGWLTDLDQAYAISQKTGKPIMANFTGSDWCGWCKKLTASVFSTPEFKKWADKNVVLLELDFPRRKQLPENIRKQNYSLQQAFQVQGYPTVWVFRAEKDPGTGQYQLFAIGKTGYTPTAQEFTSNVDQMLKRSAKGG